jgi:glutamyl-tRNA reductase
VPTIVALRDKVEDIRQREVERHFGALASVDPRQRDAVERLTRAIVNKILHHPLTALRRHQAARGETFYVEAARLLFHLGEAEPSDDEET